MKLKHSAIGLAIATFMSSAQAADVQTNGGLKVKSDDGAYQFEFGGRVHLDYATFDNDDGKVVNASNGPFFRRTYLQAKAKLYNNWSGFIQLDTPNSVTSTSTTTTNVLTPPAATPGTTSVVRTASVSNNWVVKEAWLAYALPGETLQQEFIVGQYKQPMGLEELTSSNNITFMERSQPINGIASNFRRGIGWNVSGGNFTARSSFYSGTNGGNPDTGTGFGSRLTWTPMKDKLSLLHIGASGAYEKDLKSLDNSNRMTATTWSTRHGQRITVGTAHGSDFEVIKGGLEAAYVYGPFSLQGEYLYAKAEDQATKFEASYVGYYVMASYFLTGESRPYRPANGVFDRVKPYNSKGAWEIAARFSSYESDTDAKGASDIEEGQVRDVTLGLNYYVNPQVRLMFNYVYADILNKLPSGNSVVDGNPQAFMVRTQFDFF